MRSNPEDNLPLENSDPLDRLLLRVPLVEPDAWFSARALARCRYSQPNKTVWSWKHFWGPRWVVGGVLALFLCAFSFQQQLHQSHRAQRHQERNVQEAFEVVASVGTDPDSSSSSSQDSSF